MVKINKEVISTKINSKGQVKLLHEYKNIINKDPNILGFKVIIENDDLYKWIVKIFKFDDNFPITQDMKKYNIDTINLELSFPQTYPFQPPFIRVLNPRFKYKTGHILSDGGICIELLTPSGWSSVYTIESILIQIKALIIEGDGRIDENKWNIPYTLQEAKQGFERMARSYGWLK
jgi:ubiquitin-conjugating enzyme E2 Q